MKGTTLVSNPFTSVLEEKMDPDALIMASTLWAYYNLAPTTLRHRTRAVVLLIIWKFCLVEVDTAYWKGNLEHLENYRPVSTLPIFGQIFEKIVYKRPYCYLSSQLIISSRQFRFCEGYSTSHAINFSVNHIERRTSRKEHMLDIFIDLSNAFDTIDHKF
jgi:hypothetical protein